MPEALAIFAVFAVVVVVAFTARSHVGNPRNFDAGQEFARLQQHESWLRERLERARRENWGDEMIAQFASELELTSGRLAAANKA